MDDTLKNMQTMVNSMREFTEKVLSENLTDKVLSTLTPQELEIIAEAKNALNFEGGTPSEKLNNLTTLLQKYGL